MTDPVPALRLRGITKRFGEVVANDGIDLDVRAGEIHALLGENGAGKSTLMKVVYGFHRPDAGTIAIDGREVRIRDPHDARASGIGMLFQTFTLIPAFTVTDNVALFRPTLPFVLDPAALARELRELAARYGFEIRPDAVVGRLAVGERQKVEILKLLLGGARILIFDEPTSVLAPHEVEGLFAVFRRLRAEGFVVIFITHKLREVLACADRITVLRHGKLAGTVERASSSEREIVSLMFGASPPQVRAERATVGRDAAGVLRLEGVETVAQGESVGLHGLDLEVRAGEIVGIAGVAGNGQEELGDVVLGARPIASGRKLLFGRDATRWSVGEVRASGVAFIPEDPLWMAVVPSMTGVENMALRDTREFSSGGGLTVDLASAREALARALDPFGVRSTAIDAPAGALSGGNLQRLVFAREMSRDPRLVLALYPTRGLDVPSAAAAQRELLAARERGAAVVLISQDLEELFALSDRLVVLYRGRIAGEFRPAEVSRHEVGRLMTGAAA